MRSRQNLALNAVNSLESVDYASGACPKGSWVLADQLHCMIYRVWQPFVRTWGTEIANQFHWAEFQARAGSRILVSTMLAGALIWAMSLVFLLLLKREFVRPRYE
jgi:hypothetical protein